jgi:ribonucleoside-diphosphate reductase alpha chain
MKGDLEEGRTYRFMIEEQVFYLTVDEFPDGKLRRISVKVNKEGGRMRVYGVIGDLITIGLESGVPLQKYIQSMKHHDFAPSGPTSNDDIPLAKSPIDFIGRWLELKYLKTSSQ